MFLLSSVSYQQHCQDALVSGKFDYFTSLFVFLIAMIPYLRRKLKVSIPADYYNTCTVQSFPMYARYPYRLSLKQQPTIMEYVPQE